MAAIHAWAVEHPEAAEEQYGDVLDYVLHGGDDLTGWTPPDPTPDDLRAWREAEGLTQERAATLAGVQPLAWGRWERGERDVPQWLRDTLMQRWGSSP